MTVVAPTTDTTPFALRDFEITNTCQCYICLECSLGYTGSDGSPCENCDGTIEHSNFCFDCTSDDKEIISETATAWFAANPAPDDLYVIEGSGMGWRGRSGTKIITATEDVSDAIAVDAEWTQCWFIDPKAKGDFKATQSHHDSLGEVYMVRPATGSEAREWQAGI